MNKEDPRTGSQRNGGAVRPARGPRYGRGSKGTATASSMRRASESDDPIYQRVEVDADGHSRAPGRKNTIHSVLTALPVLMLVIGLIVFYRNEDAQTEQGPLRAASEQVSGRYAGVSVVRARGTGRHYLWLESTAVDGGEDTLTRRGYRLSEKQAAAVREALVLEQTVIAEAAPTVEGSDTRWVWRLIADDDVVLIDDSERLR